MHRMILTTADLEVKAVITARRKDASVAQVVEQPPRKRQVETSSVSSGPKISLRGLLEKWTNFEELGKRK